jgi:uncharacterized protein (TIGR02996 family)
MNDDHGFLRNLLASPGDGALRLVYADWLEERGDPRAKYLRLDREGERINFVAWLEKIGRKVDYYVERDPTVEGLRKEHEKRKVLRAQLKALPERIDPEWLAFMNTLACSFQPFLFFSNHGPVEFSAHELPFTGTIGTRGAVVTFQGQFGGGDAWDAGSMPVHIPAAR